MRIDVVTIFPDLFPGVLSQSLLGKALEQELLEVAVHDLRDFSEDKHKSVDDEPYGGGSGMVLKAEPLLRAVRSLRTEASLVILLSPQGPRLDDGRVQELATTHSHLILVCGRYEGVDERFIELEVDLELSIGDYVLSGGELPALVLIEALSRQIPGVVKRLDSVLQDSFRTGALDHPHYTRPADVEGHPVPAVLVSGDHGKIAKWRRKEALRATFKKRPELLDGLALDTHEQRFVKELSAAKLAPGGRSDG